MTAPGARRAALLVAVAVVLAVAAVVLLVAGVQVRETTGGLLVTPIRQLHLVGGALLAGTVAGVAAVLVTLSAVPAVRRARRSAPADGGPPPEDGPDRAPVRGDTAGDTAGHTGGDTSWDRSGEAETATISPGPDRSS